MSNLSSQVFLDSTPTPKHHWVPGIAPPQRLYMEKSFKVTFSNNSTADAIRMQPSVELPLTLQELGLRLGEPVLVVIGGASKLSQEDFERVRLLFLEVLAPLAKKWKASVVDGGTDAGVMRLMGQARAETNATFPLVGVTPIGLAVLPGDSLPSIDSAPLEPNHTHFILVPGDHWGDESSWIAQVATELANGSPSVTVLINGGEVTWQDAFQNIEEGRSVIAIAGSGRTADILAAVLRGKAEDRRAEELVASGLVQAIDLTSNSHELAMTIEKIFTAGK